MAWSGTPVLLFVMRIWTFASHDAWTAWLISQLQDSKRLSKGGPAPLTFPLSSMLHCMSLQEVLSALVGPQIRLAVFFCFSPPSSASCITFLITYVTRKGVIFP